MAPTATYGLYFAMQLKQHICQNCLLLFWIWHDHRCAYLWGVCCTILIYWLCTFFLAQLSLIVGIQRGSTSVSDFLMYTKKFFTEFCTFLFSCISQHVSTAWCCHPVEAFADTRRCWWSLSTMSPGHFLWFCCDLRYEVNFIAYPAQIILKECARSILAGDQKQMLPKNRNSS